MSPTLWQRQDPAFVEVLRLLTIEVGDIHLHVVLVVKLFLRQMKRKRTKQVVVRWSQVRRIRWMKNGNPSGLQSFFAGRICNMGSCVIMQIVNSILVSLEFFCNPDQLLTVEISSGGATIWKNFPLNNPIDIPPNAQYHLLGAQISLRYCYACFTRA